MVLIAVRTFLCGGSGLVGWGRAWRRTVSGGHCTTKAGESELSDSPASFTSREGLYCWLKISCPVGAF